MTGDNGNARRRRAKAVQLLTKMLAAGWVDLPRIASELIVDERTVAMYMSGEIEMPLDRQLCLARFLIEQVPPLARSGHNLLGQIQGAMAFSQSQTGLHRDAPVRGSRAV